MFGTVFRATAEGGARVAIKVINGTTQDQAKTADEIAILRALTGHPNVVGFLGATGPYLFFEDGGVDLRRWVVVEGRPLRTRRWMRALLSGLAWAHANRVAHLDVKPTNLLIDRRTAELRIADWGNSEVLDAPNPLEPAPYRASGSLGFERGHEPDHQPQTMWWRAPEVLLGAPRVGTPADVWSAGMILWWLALGGGPRYPVEAENESELLWRLWAALGSPTTRHLEGTHWAGALPWWPPTWPARGWGAVDDLNARALLPRMLEPQPADRVTATDALDDPYF